MATDTLSQRRRWRWVLPIAIVFVTGACGHHSADEILAQSCAAGDSLSCVAAHRLDNPALAVADPTRQTMAETVGDRDVPVTYSTPRRDDEIRTNRIDPPSRWERYRGFPGVSISAGVSSGYYGSPRGGIGIGLTL